MASNLFPAPAGMNRRPAGRPVHQTAVPRASGDEPVEFVESLGGWDCSPRQRG